MASPETAIHVDLVARNDVLRYGLERILGSLPRVARLDVHQSFTQRSTGYGDGATADVVVATLADAAPATSQSMTVGTGTKLMLAVESSRPADVAQAARVHADGFIDLDDLSADALDDALRQVHLGGAVPMPATLLRSLMDEVRSDGNPRNAGSQPGMTLTPRETDVLGLLVDGLSNKQIARRLGISSHGVKRLVSNVLAKLHCPNRTLAVAKAIRDDLCPRIDLAAAPS